MTPGTETRPPHIHSRISSVISNKAPGDIADVDSISICSKDPDQKKDIEHKNEEFEAKIRWPDLTVQLFIHLGCLYGFILVFTSAKVLTTIWGEIGCTKTPWAPPSSSSSAANFTLDNNDALFSVYTSGFGITAGAHRLWSHRAYKAKWPLRLLLVLLFTVTGQRHVYAWALDHRVHHKYSETDADPHNARRGFWFSHVGWLVLTPHPDVVAKRSVVDMSDLESDPIVMWQKRLYIPLFALFVIFIPVAVPMYFWEETLWTSFWLNFNARFCITLNIAFFVNSVAHMWGNKPYDKGISPVENLAVSLAALGEGWHNYHHVFPWDYKTSELGNGKYNPTTKFINFFASLGWAYDLKSVSPGMVARRAERSGDGTHQPLDEEDEKHGHHHDGHGPAVWGYGDADILPEDQEELEAMSEGRIKVQ